MRPGRDVVELKRAIAYKSGCVKAHWKVDTAGVLLGCPRSNFSLVESFSVIAFHYPVILFDSIAVGDVLIRAHRVSQ